MSNNSDHRAALQAIRDVLAADCACAPHDFLAGGLVMTSAVEQAGRRRFPFPAKPLWVFSMGAGVVVSCSSERMAWIRANLGSLGRDAIFAGLDNVSPEPAAQTTTATRSSRRSSR